MSLPFKVRVLYDFSGEPNTAELSITAEEILTVTRVDVGDGWWEGLNSASVSGIFPESYVERISTGPPLAAPPVHRYSNDWNTPAQDAQDSEDDWDDTYSEIPNTENRQDYSNSARYQNEPDTVSEQSVNIDNKGTVTKKSLNRFATFVKSGGESYILGELKLNVLDQDKFTIVRNDEHSFSWPDLTQNYTVHITSPKKASKLKGLKTFIAYQLTPSFDPNKVVSRRYKQFDWLHERLTEKYTILAVPPLPDKQISGRYEDQFIEHRRLQLQEFINYVCKHPILSNCKVWHHFLTCTDEKQWKSGKRGAERDPLVGANFCLCIQAPDKELLQSQVDTRIDTYSMFIQSLDGAIKNILVNGADETKKYQGLFKREFLRLGDSFHKLGVSLTTEEKFTDNRLPGGIVDIGTAYHDIARYYEEQPKLDWEPLINRLYLYRGITSAFPDIFAVHKGAQLKRKECEKNGVLSTELQEIRKRCDVLTHSILAEINHFKNQRDADFKAAMQVYVTEQINFYNKIVGRLQQALEKLNEA